MTFQAEFLGFGYLKFTVDLLLNIGFSIEGAELVFTKHLSGLEAGKGGAVEMGGLQKPKRVLTRQEARMRDSLLTRNV